MGCGIDHKIGELEMRKKISFIFPGQGSQYVGMGRDFFKSFSLFKEIFEMAEDLLKSDIKRVIFDGKEEELAATKNSQIFIYLVSYAMMRVLQAEIGISPDMCAGLSLGEYSAIAASLKLSFEDTLFLIDKRASFMEEVALKKGGAMAAVLGMDFDAVRRAIEDMEDVWVANFNTRSQTVISGTKEGVEKASLMLDKAKRVIRLKVSGPFHTPLMEGAKLKLANELEGVNFKRSDIQIISNVSARPVKEGEEKKELVEHIVRGVRWMESVAFMEGFTDIFLEIGPKRVLTRMNRENAPNSINLSLAEISDLEKIEKTIS